MSRKPWSTRIALWAAVCALLLKAAVPMLASAAAQAQGKTLVEVCTVYGVATVAFDGRSDKSPADHSPAHSGDHCALSALLAFAAPEPAASQMAVPSSVDAVGVALPSSFHSSRDASAEWAAQLRHGPPSFT